MQRTTQRIMATEDDIKQKEAAQEQAQEPAGQAQEQPSEQETAAQEQDEKSKEQEKSDHRKCKNSRKEAELQKQVADLTDKLSKEKDDYVRLMAEFENFRRRSSEEKLAIVNTAAADTIKGMLPVLDDCERAMQMLANSSDEAAKEGTSLIYNKLMNYLKTRGLEVIEARGKEFDTDFHEAVTQFPAPTEDMKGKVIDVVQTGYLLGGKVLRFAKVVVGA